MSTILSAGERFTLHQLSLDTCMACERVNGSDAIRLESLGLIRYVASRHGYVITAAGREIDADGSRRRDQADDANLRDLILGRIG